MTVKSSFLSANDRVIYIYITYSAIVEKSLPVGKLPYNN